MRRLILFLALIPFGAVSAMAQDALFKDALKRGKCSDGYYTTVRQPKDFYEIDAYNKIAKEKGYILNHKNVKTESIIRFGNEFNVVSSIDFFLPDDFNAYAYSQLAKSMGSAGVSYSDLKTTGNAYLFKEDKINKFMSELQKDDPNIGRKYYEYKQVRWSGAVDEKGRIVGSGQGFIMDNDWICCFKGTFGKGYPVDKSDFLWMKWSNKLPDFFSNHPEVSPELSTIYGIDPQECINKVKCYIYDDEIAPLSRRVKNGAAIIYVFFKSDKEANDMRYILAPLATAGIEDAAKALDYLTLCDALSLSSSIERKKWAETLLHSDNMPLFIKSNYFHILSEGENVAKSMLTSSSNHGEKHGEIYKTIYDWKTYIVSLRDQGTIKMRETMNQLLCDALTSSGSNNNSNGKGDVSSVGSVSSSSHGNTSSVSSQQHSKISKWEEKYPSKREEGGILDSPIILKDGMIRIETERRGYDIYYEIHMDYHDKILGYYWKDQSHMLLNNEGFAKTYEEMRKQIEENIQ